MIVSISLELFLASFFFSGGCCVIFPEIVCSYTQYKNVFYELFDYPLLIDTVAILTS